MLNSFDFACLRSINTDWVSFVMGVFDFVFATITFDLSHSDEIDLMKSKTYRKFPKTVSKNNILVSLRENN